MDNGAGQQFPKFERKHEDRKFEDRKHEARSSDTEPTLKPLDLPTLELLPIPLAVGG